MKSTLLLLFLSVSFFLQAQNWCPPGAVWGYSNSGVATNGATTLWYEKDTIVDGRSCGKIVGYSQYYTNFVSQERDLFTYAVNDTVFFYYENAFRPVYFFGASVGDTLTYRSPLDMVECDSFFSLVVDSVATLQINGQSLRYYKATHIGPNAPYPYHMEVVEKFGAINNYLLPFGECSGFIDLFYFDLGCYEDGSFSKYQVNPNITCRDPFTSIYDVELLNTFTLHPNPANTQLSISTEGTAITQYQLLDYSGKQVGQGQAASSTLNIDVAQLPQGIYLLKLELANGQYAVKRFVKE